MLGAGGHYGLTGRIIKNLEMPKKLRQGVQNSGKITSNLELLAKRISRKKGRMQKWAKADFAAA